MDRFDFMFGILIAVLILNFVLLIDNFIINKTPDRAILYQGEFMNSTFNGAYMPNVGFFVDTRGRSLEQINKTLHHEMLHALIMQDNDSRKHFCGEN